MTRHQIREITQQRLRSWTNRFVSSHATPVLALGFGHDDHKGESVLTVCEDVPDGTILLLVARTLALMCRGTPRVEHPAIHALLKSPHVLAVELNKLHGDFLRARVAAELLPLHHPCRDLVDMVANLLGYPDP